jgi:hypothetical protein
MQKIRVWVHHWVLARISEQHQHLVSGVKKGDGTRFVRQGVLMKNLPLDFRSFSIMAHQWVLDQYEYFDTIQDAKCDGTPKMPECVFVDLVV